MSKELARKISIKPQNRGKLHASLGVPPGQKIPLGQIQRAANSNNPTLARRAQFALNARQWGK